MAARALEEAHAAMKAEMDKVQDLDQLVSQLQTRDHDREEESNRYRHRVAGMVGVLRARHSARLLAVKWFVASRGNASSSLRVARAIDLLSVR